MQHSYRCRSGNGQQAMGKGKHHHQRHRHNSHHSSHRHGGRQRSRGDGDDDSWCPKPQDDDDDERLAAQLRAMGLCIRDTRGDGNCLFRALSDQRTGNDRDHLELRRLTVAYMRATADDFAPFLPDHLKFDDYLDDLSTPGEYAGNDALVAFARAAHVDIYVHQLDQPVWIVRAVEGKVMGEQLHIAYQSYEHYSSVRLCNESAEEAQSPAHVVFEGLNAPKVPIKPPPKATASDDEDDDRKKAGAKASSSSSASSSAASSNRGKTHKSHRQKMEMKRERKKRRELERQAEAQAKLKGNNTSGDGDDVAKAVAALTI